MLELRLASYEEFDSETNTFSYYPPVLLKLEHSLLSLSKWESKWKKPFLSKEPFSYEEFVDYVRCMTINNVDQDVYRRLTNNDILVVKQYIDDPMTATTFNNRKPQKPSKEIITAELVYYWMVAAQIPFEAEKWHLNRLLTLIRICDIKSNSGNDKMTKKDIYAHNKQLNAARRARLGTKG